MITLERTDGDATVHLTAPAEDVTELRRRFAADRCVVVPGLFGPELLAWVREQVELAAFEQHDLDGLAGELTLDATSQVVARLLFLMNHPELHRTIEAITGTGPIVRFDARIYRRLPVIEHYDNWHDDYPGSHRLVTMSVNLSSEPYGGGVLQLRRDRGPEPIAEVHNTGPGDALLFPIAHDLDHRVTRITSGVKTALAGWFGNSPPWPTPVDQAWPPG